MEKTTPRLRLSRDPNGYWRFGFIDPDAAYRMLVWSATSWEEVGEAQEAANRFLLSLGAEEQHANNG